MGKKVKVGKNRLDKFYHLAKEQGYRSRAAFKLVQLNQKFDFLSKSKCLIDLCAAPGGWLQVATKYMPQSSLILGVDLVSIKPVGNCIVLQEDITTQKCRASLKREMKRMEADVVLHDGAPNVGANWTKDAYNQSELVLHSVHLASEFLRKGGWFVTKVFRSQDYNSLIWVFKQLFKRVTATKPMASRAESAEIFVVCESFLKPKSIDPKMFDPKHVFNQDHEISERQKRTQSSEFVDNILHPTKFSKQRHREGYEDGATTLFKTNSVLEFIRSDSPIEVLSNVNRLQFVTPTPATDLDQALLDAVVRHPLTTNEVRSLCEDVKVLGKQEFKHILRWRLKMRVLWAAIRKQARGGDAAKESEEKADSDEGEDAPGKAASGSDDEDEDDDKLIAEMEARAHTLMRQRKKREKKAKDKARRALERQGVHVEDPEEYLRSAEGAGELFSISKMQAGARAHSEKIFTKMPERDSDEEEADSADHEDNSNSDDDSEEEEGEFVDHLETELDTMYASYMERATRRDVATRKAHNYDQAKAIEGSILRQKYSKALQGGTVEADADAVSDDDDDYSDIPKRLASVDEKSVLRDAESLMSGKAQRWFGQNSLSGFDAASLLGDLPGSNGNDSRKRKRDDRKAGTPAALNVDSGDESELSDSMSESDFDEEDLNRAREELGIHTPGSRKSAAVAAATKAEDSDDEGGHGASGKSKSAKSGSKSAGGDDDEDEENDSGHESLPDEMYDEDKRAETLALAKKFLRKKIRMEAIDASYNRFTFGEEDMEGMPGWFLEDEKKHSRPQRPVTKDDVMAEKERFKALNIRPIKKVAEAKFRKRRKTMRKMERAEKTAGALLESSEMNDVEKARAVEKVYRKAMTTQHAKRVNVVTRKFQQGSKRTPSSNVRTKYKKVDTRLKKDERGRKAADRRNKKSKR